MARPKKKQPKTHAREWHEGSVVAVGGRWRAFRAPIPIGDGKTRRSSKTFDTEAEASVWARGEIVSDRVTLGEWLDYWLALTWPRLQPNTQATYRGFVDACRPLAHIPIADLSEDDWQAFTNGLLDRWSREHVKVWKTIIGGALRAALPKHITYNPLKTVKLPRPTERMPKAWRQEEVTRLLMAARGGTHEMWLVVSLATGVRIGEARAFERTDFDLQALEVTVSKSIVQTTNRIGPTKTGRIRVVDLPAEIVPMLVAHFARLPASCERVFGRQNGEPLSSNSFRQWLQRICKRAGVRMLPPHATRHTYASLALDARVPVQDVAQALGHASPNTTHAIYSHWISKGQRRVATAIGSALSFGVSGDDKGELHAELHADEA